MPERVKSRRTYRSPLRQAQAAATRTAVLEAAQRLFESYGYRGTTMEAIAEEAGVSLKTAYLTYTTKSGLLRAVWDLLLKGDTDEAPVAARQNYLQILAEADPERRLRLNARNAVVVKQRIGGILRVIRSAAPVDDDMAALWALIQSDFHANQQAILAPMAAAGQLRGGLDLERASDILWTLNHPDVWLLLHGEREWTPAEFEVWLADTCCALLLPRALAHMERGESGEAAERPAPEFAREHRAREDHGQRPAPR
jgi:AcrR family transcriptional regulator